MDLGGIELKLYEVHFAGKLARWRKELARWRKTCLQSAQSAVSTPNVNKEVAKYPDAELARRGVLGLPPS